MVGYCLSRPNVQEDGQSFFRPQRLVDGLLHCQHRSNVSKNGLSFLLAPRCCRRPSTNIGSCLPIVKRHTVSHTGRVLAVVDKQQHMNINGGDYGKRTDKETQPRTHEG